jgi:hypothetical protein
MTLMRLLLPAGLALPLFLASPASAQERLGDGALGALAGALVGGPIGLVAGGVVAIRPVPPSRRAGGFGGTGIITGRITGGMISTRAGPRLILPARAELGLAA